MKTATTNYTTEQKELIKEIEDSIDVDKLEEYRDEIEELFFNHE